MNKERMEQLAQFVESGVVPLDMEVITTGRALLEKDGDTVRLVAECGTACCILGDAALLMGLHIEPIYPRSPLAAIVGKNGDPADWVYNRVADWLGLDMRQSWRL